MTLIITCVKVEYNVIRPESNNIGRIESLIDKLKARLERVKSRKKKLNRL